MSMTTKNFGPSTPGGIEAAVMMDKAGRIGEVMTTNEQANQDRMKPNLGAGGVVSDTRDGVIKEANALAYKHGLSNGGPFFYRFLILEKRVSELLRRVQELESAQQPVHMKHMEKRG